VCLVTFFEEGFFISDKRSDVVAVLGSLALAAITPILPWPVLFMRQLTRLFSDIVRDELVDSISGKHLAEQTLA